MRYLVCDVEGQLHDRTVPGTYRDVIYAEVGPEGWDMVRLRGGMLVDFLGVFVNDIGLLAQDRYPRNVVGSCLLGALGAYAQPYAGSIVFTGWDDHGGVEVCDLSDNYAAAVREIWGQVRIALGIDAGPPLSTTPAAWIAAMTDLAELVTTSPTPMPTVITDPAEVLARAARWVMSDVSALHLVGICAALIQMLWLQSAAAIAFAKVFGIDISDRLFRPFRVLFAELRPFYLPAVGVNTGILIMTGEVLGWNTLGIAMSIANWFLLKDVDDDDRWRRRKAKLASKVEQRGGRLVAVPVGGES